MFRIDAIFFGFAHCHHLELLALYLGTGLYLLTSGEVGVGVQMIFVATTEHLHVPPPLKVYSVFFYPAIRWWKIS